MDDGLDIPPFLDRRPQPNRDSNGSIKQSNPPTTQEQLTPRARPSEQEPPAMEIAKQHVSDRKNAGEGGRRCTIPDQNSAATIPPVSYRVLVSRPASTIQPEAIRWLWPQRIALGKISLIAGQPGLGKSQITAYLTAITSSGGIWPTGEKCDAGDALFLSAEDDPADTIRPRLEACGANLDRVHTIETVRSKGRDQPFNLKTDVELLAAKLETNRDVKLVIIDPISAYLGGIDSHNNSDVRGVLAPLAKLATDHSVAVVCVTHLNKPPTNLNKSHSTDPLTRVIGSTAFCAAVRAAFLVAPDKIDPDLRLFLPLKSNISRACPGLAFRIEPHTLGATGIETSRVAWDSKQVQMTASEALSPSTEDEIDNAKQLLAVCIRVFNAENATELRASQLIDLLREHESVSINAKLLKKHLALCGVEQHRRSDANYYREGDFIRP